MSAELVLPATCLQRRQVLADLGTGPGANVHAAWRLRGPLDRAALRRTLEDLVARHEALRTGLRLNRGEVEQRIERKVTLPLDSVRRAADRRTIGRILRHRGTQAFDVGVAPLARARLVRLGAGDHLLFWTLHHAICDGWSLRVLLDDFRRAYAAATSGLQPEWPAVPIQLGDYAAWEREHVDAAARAYWQALLKDPEPELVLPRRHISVDGAGHFEVAEALKPVSPAVVVALDAASRDLSATLSMTITAAFAALVAPYAGVGSVAMGTTEANRERTEMKQVVGCCIDFIPLRIDISGDPSFAAIVARVRDQVRSGHQHRLPIGRMGDARWPHSPAWFDVLVNFTPTDPSRTASEPSPSTPGVHPALGPTSDRYVAKYNWSGWRVLGPVLGQDARGGLTGTLLHNRLLVPAELSRRLVERFDGILRAVAIRPDRRLSSLSGVG